MIKDSKSPIAMEEFDKSYMNEETDTVRLLHKSS